MADTDSPTTLDVTAPPPDELSMTFTAAAAARNGSESFIAHTEGPDLFALPLSAGITVSGELVDDPSTITAPFLPGDTILACLIPPQPWLLSAHADSLRLRIPTISALELPGTMLPETGCAYLAALMTGAAILKRELHLPLIRTPTASPTPAEDGGVESYNHKRILIVGGQTPLGAALVQLLHRALPDARISVTSTMRHRPALSLRTLHMLALGAASATDGAADDLTSFLSPTFDIIVNAVRGAPVREDVGALLDGIRRLVDCPAIDVEVAVERFVHDEPDCVTTLHEMLMRAADVFDGNGEEEEESGVHAGVLAPVPVLGKALHELDRGGLGKVVEGVA